MNGDALAAAAALIRSFGPTVPAKAHSVYVQTRVDPATKEFVRVIMVHLPPNSTLNPPYLFQGFPVERAPWGKVLGQVVESA